MGLFAARQNLRMARHLQQSQSRHSRGVVLILFVFILVCYRPLEGNKMQYKNKTIALNRPLINNVWCFSYVFDLLKSWSVRPKRLYSLEFRFFIDHKKPHCMRAKAHKASHKCCNQLWVKTKKCNKNVMYLVFGDCANSTFYDTLTHTHKRVSFVSAQIAFIYVKTHFIYCAEEEEDKKMLNDIVVLHAFEQYFFWSHAIFYILISSYSFKKNK